MAEAILVDNDVLIKASAYRLAAEFGACLSDGIGVPTVLGLVRFAVPSQIKRSRQVLDKEGALAEFELMLGALELVEPTDEELDLAAAFEEAAATQGVELDRGESQLLAILIERAGRLVLTGDKRAIAAIERIAPPLGLGVAERIACFEQLMHSLIVRHDPGELQRRICRERDADRTLSMCFACASGQLDLDSLADGLRSHIGSVRSKAPTVLLAGEALSAMVA